MHYVFFFFFCGGGSEDQYNKTVFEKGKDVTLQWIADLFNYV